MLLVLQDRMLNLIDPDDHSLLHSQPISSIRVWGVGRDHDRSVMLQTLMLKPLLLLDRTWSQSCDACADFKKMMCKHTNLSQAAEPQIHRNRQKRA